VDILWFDDMQLDAAETTTEEDELEQDEMHVLEQDQGSNPDDPTRGLGIANIASRAITQDARSWEQRAVAELTKDSRVDSATAKVVVIADGSLELDCKVMVDGESLDVTVPVPTAGGQTT